jgi:hypothetical protein
MRKSILLLWASLLSSCAPLITELTCGPNSVEGKAWASAIKENTTEAYRAYLADYPEGCFVAEATKMLKKPVVPPKVKKVVGGAAAVGGAINGSTY